MGRYLLRPDKEDLRDRVFHPESFQLTSSLPKKIDLRPNMPPVFDQGELGSCTANAIVSLKEYYILNTPAYNELSRLFLYYEERYLENNVSEDSGASLRDGMKVLKNTGCSPERDFPYDISKFTEAPSATALRDASSYRISEYHRILGLSTLKTALASGQPVVLGIAIYESFETETVAQTGIIPMPKLLEKQLGGHAVLAVGYDDDKKQVICRNSWGDSWGDQGYFYLPYNYICNPLLTNDMWTGR